MMFDQEEILLLTPSNSELRQIRISEDVSLHDRSDKIVEETVENAEVELLR